MMAERKIRNLDMLYTPVPDTKELLCLSDMTITDMVKTVMAMNDKAFMKSVIIGLSISLRNVGDKYDITRDPKTLEFHMGEEGSKK